MGDKRVVITGIGPISSIGIGKKDLWDNLLSGKTNVKLEEEYIDGELWDKFHLHKVDGFDISDFGIDKGKLDWIKDWKSGDEVRDLLYLIAAVKLEQQLKLKEALQSTYFQRFLLEKLIQDTQIQRIPHKTRGKALQKQEFF